MKDRRRNSAGEPPEMPERSGEPKTTQPQGANSRGATAQEGRRSSFGLPSDSSENDFEERPDRGSRGLRR